MTGTRDTLGRKVTGGAAVSGGITSGLTMRQVTLLGAMVRAEDGRRWDGARVCALYAGHGVVLTDPAEAERDLVALADRGFAIGHGPGVDGECWYEIAGGAR
ncbi:hypothetical protein [Streptomyces sp. NBRC 109706]|uniref:hypothetical protein n=1 Tax=Streptomyces sp. NBRC 109706 TaxID=1550035 RepID=UPI0007861E2D|nr:hypothetical protein [Streptomyces sp. NBRC 109706]